MEYQIIHNRAKPINTYVSIIAITISAFGIILGLALLYIISRKKWSSLYIDLKLVFITIFIDLLVSCWSITCSVLDLSVSNYYIANKTGCSISATLSIVICTGSINCVAVTAIERYTIIKLQRSVPGFVYYIILISLFIINIGGCLLTIYLNGFTVHPTSLYCMSDFESLAGHVSLGFVGFSEFLSLVSVYFAYIGIIIARRKQALEIERSFPLQIGIRKKANSTTFKSSLIIIGASISNGPYCILTLICLAHPELYTPILDGIMCCCMISNAVFNSLLILGMRPDLVDELISLLK